VKKTARKEFGNECASLIALSERLQFEAVDPDSKVPVEITDFWIADKRGNLMAVDTGALENVKGVNLYLSGKIRPKGSLDDDEWIDLEKAGKIDEWWITSDRDSDYSVVGVSTEAADYYMTDEPSASYAQIFSSLQAKSCLAHDILDFLDVNPDGTFDQLLQDLAGDEPEDNLREIKVHANFLVDHIVEHEHEHPDVNLTNSPAFLGLCELTDGQRRDAVKHYRAPTVAKTKATVTPVIRGVCEQAGDLFEDHIRQDEDHQHEPSE
jgi:hypothetical protein